MSNKTGKEKIPTATIKRLLLKAESAKKNSYSPYSKFKVGAAVLGASGRMYSGCNVENSSYGLTICAERVAVLNAVSSGERKILAAAVCAGRQGVLPCGACLQVLAEFSGDIPVVVPSAGGGYRTEHISALLPESFVMGKKK